MRKPKMKIRHGAGLERMRAEFSREEFLRVSEALHILDQLGKNPTPSQIALSAWMAGRSPVNLLTMYDVDAEAVLDEVVRSYDVLVKLLHGFEEDNPSAPSVLPYMKAARARPDFTEIVKGDMVYAMDHLRKNYS